MSKIRSPGVYYERNQDRIPNLSLLETGQPAFLGLATRGPLHAPIKITSYDDFLDVYGPPLEEGFLGPTVRGYFENSGQICYVVRIAHTFKRGRTKVASLATHTLEDAEGKPTIRVDASSEGTWGNEIKVTVRVPRHRGRQTLLTRDLPAGDNRVQVRSTRGIGVGSIVRLHDGENERFITVARTEGKELSWHEPLDIGFKSSAPTYVEPITFEIDIDVPGYREQMKDLSFSPLSGRYFERYINAESQLIRVENLQSPSPFPQCLPKAVDAQRLDGGSDGLDDLTPQDFIGFNNGPGLRYGLGALEAVPEVDLVAIPDLFSAMKLSKGRGFRSYKDVQAVQEAMLNHCERLLNRFAVLDVPPKASFEQTLQWRQMFDSSYGGLYYPWLVFSEGGRRRTLPPSGYVCGVMARTDQSEGVAKPPANEEVRGIVDLDVNLLDSHIALLNRQGVNCIKVVPGRGLRIWGARTMSSDIEWRYVNVRRAFNAIRHAIMEGTQWVVFEPNNEELWTKIRRQVSAFLTDLYHEGFFKGADPTDAFYVRCDKNTNPVHSIENGIVQCEIGVAPVRPAEFIVFNIDQQIEDRSADDAQH